MPVTHEPHQREERAVNIEIKGINLVPRRQTFAHVARRFGEDRAASRYEEATYDVQATANFHYRPLYQPEFEIFDPRRTKITMSDWYKFKDPRQYYYATYNMARAAQYQVADRNFAIVEERGMIDGIAPAWRAKLAGYLIPLRHYEWGANMNAQLVTDWGYGTQITSAAAFSGADRLGLAQFISRIGLLLDGGSGDSLAQGRTQWLEEPHWQGVRKPVEDSFVVTDWFETFIAQNLALDGVMHPLVFEKFDRAGMAEGAAGISMLTAFARDWFADHSRWVDAVIKTAADESADNAKLLSAWAGSWVKRAEAAALPLAKYVLGDAGYGDVEVVVGELRRRGRTLGLSL
jgi:phenol hydroxylase P1 protein